MDMQVGVGVGKDGDSFKAGQDAAKAAVAKFGGKKPDVLIVLAAPKFDQQKLLDGVAAGAGTTAIIGGTTAGEIGNGLASADSVVVTALQSKDVPFSTAIGRNISKGEEKAGKQVASDAVKGMPRGAAKSMVIFTDGLAGDGLKIVNGIQSVLGEQFEIVGGALGDEAAFKKTYQYYNGKVVEDSVVGMLIGGKITTATGVRSGWESIGNRFVCTGASSNTVTRFGEERALDFYRGVLGSDKAKKLPTIGLEYPFGMIDEKAKIEGKDYFQIRAPLSVNQKDGSITLAAAIPEGKNVTITSASREDIIEGSRLAAEQAKKTLGAGGKPRLILVFSCIGRKLVLGRRTQEEIDVVNKTFGDGIPMAGFYTYGEIGPIDKRVDSLRATRWHNETVVLWVLGE